MLIEDVINPQTIPCFSSMKNAKDCNKIATVISREFQYLRESTVKIDSSVARLNNFITLLYLFIYFTLQFTLKGHFGNNFSAQFHCRNAIRRTQNNLINFNLNV